MRKFVPVALFAACFAAVPAASAGALFVNGQLGRMDADSGLADGGSDLVQGSLGYRWGFRYAEIGLEAGVGRLDDAHERTQVAVADGTVDRSYTLSSRYGFGGVNARIKTPVLPVFFIGRAGVLGMRHTLDETAVETASGAAPVSSQGSVERTKAGSYAGIGVGTTVLPLLDVGLMLTQYRFAQVQRGPAEGEYRLSDDRRDARSVNVTVEYRF